MLPLLIVLGSGLVPMAPVPAHAPEPTVHAVPMPNGSSVRPSQSLSRPSQPRVVSSRS